MPGFRPRSSGLRHARPAGLEAGLGAAVERLLPGRAASSSASLGLCLPSRTLRIAVETAPFGSVPDG